MREWQIVSWNRDYEISNDAMIRRRTHGNTRMKKGTYLVPFIGQNKTAYYSLPGLSNFHRQWNLKDDKTPKQVDHLMEEIWPEVKGEYDIDWVLEVRKWVSNNKKAQEKYLTKKITQQKRNCRKCGNPSGVNYWCNSCRAKRSEFESGDPPEGYCVGGF